MSSGVRLKGHRYVAKCKKTGLYLNFSCTGWTDDRLWAWTGNARQAQNMREQYPLGNEAVLRSSDE